MLGVLVGVGVVVLGLMSGAGPAAVATPAVTASVPPSIRPSATPIVPSGAATFQNVVAVAPATSTKAGRLLAGGASGGFHRSDDAGVSWQRANAGLATAPAVAGIAWSQAGSTGDEVFAVVGGISTNPGAVLWSRDNGTDWAVLSDGLIHEGADAQPGPRSTGDLIAWINPDLIYAGGTNGLYRFARTGGQWCATPRSCGRIPLPDTFPVGQGVIRSLAYDAGTAALYVAVSNVGIVRVTSLAATPVADPPVRGPGVFNKPARLWTMTLAAGTLYVATGRSGIWSCPVTPSGLGGCVSLTVNAGGSLPRGTSTVWTAVAAVTGPGGVQVYAGCGAGCVDDKTIYRRDITGAWTSLATTATVSTDLLSTDPTMRTPWPYAAHAPADMINRDHYVSAQLMPADVGGTPLLFSTGRAGIWRYDTTGRWHPAVHGLTAHQASTTGHTWTSAPDLFYAGQLDVVDGSVYATSEDGRVAALDAASGERRWATPATSHGEFTSFPGETDGVEASYNLDAATVNALDASTGQFLWGESLGAGLFDRTPLGVAGTFYVVTSSPDQLVALDARTGATRWSAALNGSEATQPVWFDGTIYVATDTVYAFDAATGAQRWSAPVPDRLTGGNAVVNGAPAVDVNGVYVTGHDGDVDGFDRQTGDQLWATSIGRYGTNDTAVDSGVVVAQDAGRLVGLDAATGQIRWTQVLNSTDGEPSAADGFAFVGDRFEVKAVSLANGTVAAIYPAEQSCDVVYPPAIVDRTVYFVACLVQAAPVPAGP